MIAAGDEIIDLVVWLHICSAELMRADQMTGCFVTLQEGDNSASGGLLSPPKLRVLLISSLITVKQRN